MRDYLDEVVNQKGLDLLPKYLSEEYVGHGTPYVGVELLIDESSGVKVTIQLVHSGSPASTLRHDACN